MENLFLIVLKMSVTSSYVILFVLLARLLLKKCPKKFSYILWIVVLFRLLCPISFESKLSLIPNYQLTRLLQKLLVQRDMRQKGRFQRLQELR